EREQQEAQFAARTLSQREDELRRAVATASEQIAAGEQSAAQVRDELAQLSDTSAQAGLQEALTVRVAREGELAKLRGDYEALSAQLKRADEQRLSFEHSLDPLREKITRLQLEEQAAQLGGAQYLEQLEHAQVDLAQLAEGIE